MTTVFTKTNSGLLGVATRDGHFVPDGTRTKQKISNCVFPPNWVRDAWDRGLLVVGELELRQNERGRYYAVIKGEAVQDRVESHTTHYSSFNSWRVTQNWTSGSKSVYFTTESLPVEYRTEAWEEISRKESRVKRVQEVFNQRYATQVQSEVVGWGVDESETGFAIDMETRTVRVAVVFKQTSVVRGWEIKGDKIVPVEREVITMVKSERLQEPIEKYFDITKTGVTRMSKVTEDHFDYESNDGWGTRSTTTEIYTEFKRHKFTLTPIHPLFTNFSKWYREVTWDEVTFSFVLNRWG